jgi:hypothetical protein
MNLLNIISEWLKTIPSLQQKQIIVRDAIDPKIILDAVDHIYHIYNSSYLGRIYKANEGWSIEIYEDKVEFYNERDKWDTLYVHDQWDAIHASDPEFFEKLEGVVKSD